MIPTRARRLSLPAGSTIPAVEAKGPLLLEDVGVPLPALADLVGGIARIAADHDLVISVIAHAGDGKHPSTHRLRSRRPRA